MENKLGYRLLIVEDDCLMAEGTADYFTGKGWNVKIAEEGQTALELLEQEHFHLILLDVMLPGKNGFTLCRKIRENSDVPIIFITARVLEEDKLNGYALGGDDYVTKPFSLPVLIVKVNALLKRFPSEESKSIISESITLYPAEKRAMKNGVYLNLTAKEYSLLSFFMENPMRILSRNQLLEAIWDIEGNFVDENTLSVNIRRLREKIEDNPSMPALLKNVRGLGYIWERKCEKR